MRAPRIGFGLAAASALLAGAAHAAAPDVVLEGQVACEICWAEAPRPAVPYGGEDDLACARRCAAEGAGLLLAVRNGESFDLYRLAPGEHEPGPDGFLPLVTRHARVAGRLLDARGGGVRVLAVDRIEAIEPARPDGTVERGAARPELELPDLTGAPQSLASLRGRVVVLNFWATWCQPCVEELPLLQRAQDDYGLFNVQVVGASADPAESREVVLRRARELGVRFPVWLGATTADMGAFGLSGVLPGTAILDRQGAVVAARSGLVTSSWLDEHVRPLLGKASAAADDSRTEGKEPAGDRTEPAPRAPEGQDRSRAVADAGKPARDAATVPS